VKLLMPLVCAAMLSSAAVAQSANVQKVFNPNTNEEVGSSYLAAFNQSIPVKNWRADRSFKSTSTSAKGGGKAATDLVTVFRPVAPCRLIDTRGFPAAVPAGGAIATGTTRTINAGGACGIPTIDVAALSITYHSYNPNLGLSSLISMMPVGASTAGAMVGFHSGPMNWFMTAANVKTSSNGNFDINISGGATVDVIIDVNGYFQDINELDVGGQQFDIYGNSIGDVLRVNQSGTGAALGADAGAANATALRASATGAGGTALEIGAGKFSIVGSSALNSTTRTAFVHSTTATTICSGNTQFSIVKHASLDNNPNAVILITPQYNGSSPHSASAVPTVEYYVGGCNSTSPGTGHWYIRAPGAVFANNTRYNVLIITQ
jgi:hypothetical protein